jgi:hypothetical protein
MLTDNTELFKTDICAIREIYESLIKIPVIKAFAIGARCSAEMSLQ